ncbi:hypothetical protein ACFWM0_25070 [Streptomyces sp. NPDC058405]|uniref:hypothetical protein n=1 Tax=Streptomyces sp. NPDC058405 TaxID=3346482 RepID=UPI0036673A99
MIIVFTPEGGEEQRYDVRQLRTSEATRAASAIGLRWAQVKAALPEDDPDAMRAVVWQFKVRGDAGLRFGSFDPGIEEMVTRWDHREVADLIAEALKTREEREGERADFFRMLARNSADPADTEALLKELVDEDGGPKAAPEPNPILTNSETTT